MNQAVRPVPSSFTMNRRVHHRYVMVMREGFLHAGGDRVPCTVLNISNGGLLARFYRPIELSGLVQVELPGGHVVEGSILWARKWEVGVAFSRPIDVDHVIEEQWQTGEQDRRKAVRVEVECPATLKVRKRFYYGKLRDLAPTGAKIRTQGSVKKLGPVVLNLPDLPPLVGTIAWVNGTECGIAFAEAVPIGALNEWLHSRGHPGVEHQSGTSFQSACTPQAVR